MANCATIDWREYVARQLGLVDSCVVDAIRDQFEIAFSLFAHLACGDEFLNSLYAKRYLLGFLIARFTSAVDFYVSQSRDIGRYRRDSKSQSDMQSESATQSSRKADTIALSREDSFARSEASSTSEDFTTSQSSSAQSVVADDTGSGASQSQARGSQSERSDSADDSTSEDRGRSQTVGYDTEGHLTTGHSGAKGTAEFFFSATQSADGVSDSHLGASSMFTAGDESGYTVGNFLGTSSESDRHSATSSSYFNALSDSVSQSNSASSSVSRGFSDAQSTQRDEGRGFGISESRSTTQQSSRYDMQSDSESETDIEGVTSMKQEVFAKDLSDIVSHLQRMYENNELDIAHYIASRNKMLFMQRAIQLVAQLPSCWSIYAPTIIRGDRLEICLN